MKPIRLVALTLLTFLVVFSVAIAAMSFVDRFTQADTIPAPASKDSDEIKMLQRVSADKAKEKEAWKDTISQNLQGLGTLNTKADKIGRTLNTTESNLKKVAGTPQTIEKVYRIDTSPRPVVIQVINPVTDRPVKVKRGLFQRLKVDQ